MKKIVLLVLFIVNSAFAQSGPDYRIHSHNDYLQNVPFWKALSAGATSVEADLFLVNDSLFVAHTRPEIDKGRTFEKLYLQPLEQSIELRAKSSEKLQLLIDIKSDAYSTLDAVIKSLKKYPSLRDSKTISFVISGNRPKPSEYAKYPDFILFDYQSLEKVTDSSILKKIALISLSLKNFSGWNGKGRMSAEDLDKVTSVIDSAHSFGKPFRFWATPDSKSAWKAFIHLGVEFINTDKPFECAQYLNTLSKREHRNSFFSKVYRPTFESDGKETKVENLILMIGDGNGLSQISATALANNGELSLTQIRNIGLLKTQSSDDFTTDSAGAGTAIATGRKAPNRAIGMNANGNPLSNITEILAKSGFVSGIVTTDDITGATPSAFYAHQKDRSMTDGIKKDLLKSRLSVIVSAAGDSEEKNDIGAFELVSSMDELSESKKDKIRFLFSGNEDPAPISGAIKNVLSFLDRKKEPFFLMVEGAKIDSYAHANNIGGLIEEGIAFDRAITEALKFADAQQNTLVVITADHETGGLTIPQGNVLKNEIEGDFTTDDHTGAMVPIFAYGPQSNEFQGVYENHLLFSKMLNVLGVQVER